jgi:hypothetical protein
MFYPGSHDALAGRFGGDRVWFIGRGREADRPEASAFWRM